MRLIISFAALYLSVVLLQLSNGGVLPAAGFPRRAGLTVEHFPAGKSRALRRLGGHAAAAGADRRHAIELIINMMLGWFD